MGKKVTIASYDIDIKSIEQKLTELRGALNEDAMGGDFTKKLRKEISALETQLEKVRNAYPGSGATQRQIDSYNKKMENLRIAITSFGKGAADSFDDSDDYIKKNIKSLEEYIDKVVQAKKELDKIKEGKDVPALKVSKGNKAYSEGFTNRMKEAAEGGSRQKVKDIYKEYYLEQNKKLKNIELTKGKDSEEYKTELANKENIHAIEQAYMNMADAVIEANKKIQSAQKEEAGAIEKAREVQKQAFQDVVNGAAGAEDATKKVQVQLSGWSDEARRAEDASRAFDTIENKLKSLVSAGAVFGFLSRAVRNTIQDMLELDKQFNEIAIVSDYSTTEMWKSFDSVNRVAQEFGVETKNVLEVQNLYYHQGKSMAEVNKLTAQTLTLAKITGMDYADATSNLTAVLNAYNIAAEDAVRVTDTIAAMDTNAAISSEELMTALTKTASIAANAGMSLESTEVFLTKMIETTREAPENLGTALKTIIARFGEVKQEVDGEIIEPADINKVDTALKSVGISLLDSAGQIRDLDQVFMELSAQWDGLDRNTQRYIATIAAGSRQQSRFIAMMEDYDRTLELTNIAQNSAGIGARQLEKSQESLESSINRLKSSVQELAATWVKAGIIKDFIENINNLVGAFNKVPPLLQPIVAGLALFILKYKILNPLLARYRILSEGFAKGTDTATMAEQLAQQKEIDRKVSLKNLIKTLTEAKDKTKELREETQRLKKEHAETAAVEEARADSGVNDSRGEYSERQREYEEFFNSEEALKVSAEAGDDDAKKLLDQGKTSGAVVERASRDALKEGTEEVIEEGTEKVAKKGIKDIGISLLDNIKGALTKAGKWLIAKVPAVFGKMSALAAGAVTAAVAAALVAAIAIGYAVWKTQFAASVDDTKKVDALNDAQQKYNDSLQKYNNLQKNAAKYQELRYKKFKTAEQLEEEQSVAQALVEEYPHLLDYIDEEGNYHLKNTEIINQEIEAKRQLLEQNAALYNNMRLAYAKEGIYADESTAAGATMSNIQSYYSSLGDEGIKDLRKELDAIGTLDGGSFKKLADAYASGEKYSFNHKDFSNLFVDQIDESEFQTLVEKFSETGDIEEALKVSGSYNQDQINDIVAVWTRLNEATGGLYEQLLTNIGKEVNSIYIQEADLYAQENLSDKGISQEGLQGIKDQYAAIKQETYDKAYSVASEQKDQAWMNFWTNLGSALNQTGAPALDTSGIFIDETEYASERANAAVNTFTTAIEDFFSVAEKTADFNDKVEKLNDITLSTPDDFNVDFEDGENNYVDAIYNKIKAEYIQTLNDFKTKLSELNPTIDGVDWELGALSLADKLDPAEVARFEEIFAQMGNESGILFMKAYDQVMGKLSEADRAKFLSMDLTNIDSVISTLSELGDEISNDQELLGELLGAMGGVDAVLFADIEDGAERVGKRIEDLTNKLEKFRKLAAGEGEFSDITSMLAQKFSLGEFESSADVRDFIDSGQVSWTADGASYYDNSGKTATDLAAKTTAVEYNIAYQTAQEIETKMKNEGLTLDKLSAEEQLQYDAALQTMATSYYGIEAMLYQEWKANQEGRVKALEKEIEQLKKKRDAYKELVEYMRQYDYYQNLNREISELEFDEQSIEFEIEFSTNADVIVERTLDQVNNINSQIAANQAGANAAKRNQATYRDSIEKNYGEYVSFDATGTAIVDQQKMMDLQRRITEEKAAGHEETAALLENEKAAIEASVKAYDDALKASQDYTKKTQDGFRDLEKVMKQVYQNYANAEEKVYEVIKENEDKQVEAIREKYDAIKEENDKYLDNVRETIDKERELRDRARDEEDVKKKEKKLAMMKMDTSGVYASDIMALEEELAGDYQNLEDAAIDKKIDEMENEFQTQAEAYEKDIEYMENALEYKRQSYANYQQEVNEIIMSGTEAATQWLMQNDADYLAATSANQYLMQQEFKETMANGVAAGKLIGSTMLQQVNTSLTICKDSAKGFNEAVIDYYEDTVASNDEISGSLDTLIGDYDGLTGEVEGLDEAEGQLELAIGDVQSAAEELERVQSENFQLDKNRVNELITLYEQLATKIREANSATNPNGGSTKFGEFTVRDFSSTGGTYSSGMGWTDSGRYEQTLKEIAYDNGKYYANLDGRWVVLDEDNVEYKEGNEKRVLTPEVAYSLSQDKGLYETFKNNKKFRVKESAQAYKYATGGLADYTGFAWLDGTKSKPEMVLNPLQTQAFIKLVDVLSLIGSPMGRPQSPYDNLKTYANTEALKNEYNFTINVDQMASDYDVDQMINRIEEKMIKASRYRNVTMLSKQML